MKVKLTGKVDEKGVPYVKVIGKRKSDKEIRKIIEGLELKDMCEFDRLKKVIGLEILCKGNRELLIKTLKLVLGE